MSDSDKHPRPRQCHLVKWPEFSGYGFNLHAERGKAGQFIGKVDDGSPAVAAGLKESDRIVEVNGVNIGNENHQQVVSRIKAGGEEVTLLVVDAEADKYYKENRQLIKSDSEEVLRLSSAREPRPEENDTPPEPEPETEEREPEPEQEEQEPEVDKDIPENTDYENPPEDLLPPPPQQEEEEEEEATPEEPVLDDTPEVSPVVNDVIVETPVTSAPQFYPRLCHMIKWPDFVGYGFNLHAERDRSGQFIGTVDAASPAESAGLKEGDRIIEVNGENIEKESHQNVILKVKAGGNETKLLVVDRETDNYYKEKGVEVCGTLDEVCYRKSYRTENLDDKENQVPSVNAGEDDGSRARLCHITKWPHFAGYGFNLHADKEKNGQFIGKIDSDSPAESAGLREGDRIIEVNGQNVETATHQTVIRYVKEGGDETKLLVVDGSAYQSFKARGIAINGYMSQMDRKKTEDRGAPVNGQPVPSTASAPARQVAPTPANVNSNAPQTNGQMSLSDGMNMSVKEMREMLAKKKKQDPKYNKMSFQSKLEAFQKM